MSSDKSEIDLDRELLVAYLDGELDEEQVIGVEKRLTAEPAFRQQLHQLEATWDMLDDLPVGQPTAAFTKSTLELVVTDEIRQVRKNKKNWWTLPSRILVFSALPLLAYVLTFSITHFQRNAPNRKLIADMPLLLNYELYEICGSIEFAQMLNDQGQFKDFVLDEAETESTSVLWKASQEDLDNLTTAQRSELKRKKERFERFQTEEQDFFRQFHEKMVEDPQREQILETMKEFQIWVLQFKETQRQQLLTLKNADEKLAQFNQLQNALRMQMGGRLADSDYQVVLQWFEQLIEANADAIRSKIMDLKETDSKYRMIDPGWDPKVLITWLARVDSNAVRELISDEKYSELYEQLKPRSRAVLDRKKEDNSHIGYLLALNSGARVSDKKLREFMYTQLSAEERAKLDRYSGREFRFKLLELYITKNPPFPRRRR